MLLAANENTLSQDDDILTCFCNIECTSMKTDAQLKVEILCPNSEVFVQESFDRSTKSNMQFPWREQTFGK